MERLTVLVADEGSVVALPEGYEASLRATRNITTAGNAKRLFVLSSATTLPAVSACVSRAAKNHRLQGLFIHNDLGREWVNQIFERAALRRIRNSLVHSDPEVGKRILKAAAMGTEQHFIADAAVAHNRIFVMDCAFRLYEMSFDEYPALRRIPSELRGTFTVDLDGAYLHWPTHDVDLDLDSIRTAIDPERRKAVQRERLVHDEAFGVAVKTLREEHRLRQSDVPSLSERQVRRIEKGAAATVAALDALAIAHGMDTDRYLEEVAGRIRQ